MKVIHTPKTFTNPILAEIEKIKRNLPAIKEYAKIEAEITKSKFDAYVKVGFSQDQAIELCKKVV